MHARVRSALAGLALLAPATLLSSAAQAAIPAAPVMTLYKFNGPVTIPTYRIGASGPGPQAGSLTQGSAVIPCLVVRNGRALTDASGTPYVGFEIVVDAARASDQSATRAFERAVAAQKSKRVRNHHCGPGVNRVINVRDLYQLEKPPFFDPPGRGDQKAAEREGQSTLDKIVRSFHNSPQCASVNDRMTGRRDRLAAAWDSFMARNRRKWDETTLARAKHLDYAMRTALYEGHLDRGCSAYGACERNTVVLSIRNRAVGQCVRRQGCRFPGDFQGVASDPSQYNIWDNYLTMISGLTACYLRTDLAHKDFYDRIQAMYTQNVGDAERILYGGDSALQQVFPGNAVSELTSLRHYYHPPAMGKCFPQYSRIEYMSGAIAENGPDHALIANTRIQVGERVGSGYRFKEFRFEPEDWGDDVRIEDNYSGFIVDGRKVRLSGGGGCTAYGVSPGCRFSKVGRYRTTPSWLSDGRPVGLHCRVQDLGASCRGGGGTRTITVGGSCDVDMMPVGGVR
ncbi:MAG: hypothetical protein LJE69_03660 [Thiohalocapsa sp.]|uniref:hypothetical protein n=1 Tax=Thiohalocapsa sp. TaxID=2497641 RepID=UPI0025ECE1AF|nr:hypothetical protein [Thiohalocapsa sp.]MCG6940331.1 hypothetical protein [Thiohalocapsa sp.]